MLSLQHHFCEWFSQAGGRGIGLGTVRTGTQVGTEGFIAPEGAGTPQADIYSLGKVLYEISTGKDRNEYPVLPTPLEDNAEAGTWSISTKSSWMPAAPTRADATNPPMR